MLKHDTGLFSMTMLAFHIHVFDLFRELRTPNPGRDFFSWGHVSLLFSSCVPILSFLSCCSVWGGGGGVGLEILSLCKSRPCFCWFPIVCVCVCLWWGVGCCYLCSYVYFFLHQQQEAGNLSLLRICIFWSGHAFANRGEVCFLWSGSPFSPCFCCLANPQLVWIWV